MLFRSHEKRQYTPTKVLIKSEFGNTRVTEYLLFGENVKVYDHNHCYKDVNVPIKYQGYTEAPITIGKAHVKTSVAKRRQPNQIDGAYTIQKE